MIKKILFLGMLVQQIATAQVLPVERRTDWSLAGYQDSLPVYSHVVDITSFGAIGDGAAINDTSIQQALTALGGRSGTIYFPAGNFLFNQSIELPDSVVLKGNGADSTILSFLMNGISTMIIIRGTVGGTIATLSNFAWKDSTFILLDDASAIHAGDYLRISQNDTALLFSSWAYGSVGQVVRVRSASVNRVDLNSPLRRHYTTQASTKVSIMRPRTGCGIECLKVKRLDSSVGQTTNIDFTYTARCWLKGVEGEMCNFAHVAITTSTNLEITGCYFHHAFAYGDGGQGYGIAIQNTTGECLIENNVFSHLRHSMLIQSGANGNVLGYNSSTDPYWVTSVPITDNAGDMVMHGNYPFLNLFEGNTGQNIVIDDSHANNGPFNTFFRNRAALYGIYMNASNPSDSQNFIGNEVTGTGFLMGNYSLAGAGHFAYGNNVRGTINPANTTTLTDSSYYKKAKPLFFSNSNVWPSIGAPNTPGQGTIPAQRRQRQGLFTDCATHYREIDTTQVGISNSTADVSLTLYPNPNSGSLYMSYAGQEALTILIADMAGQEVMRGSSLHADALDISVLSDGLYAVHIYEGNKYVRAEKLLLMK